MIKVGDQVIITRVYPVDSAMGVQADTICQITGKSDSMYTAVPVSGRARTLHLYPEQVRKF